MPISALDDFETRLASPAASICRHFTFPERDRTLLQARATADARAGFVSAPLILLVAGFSFDLQCVRRRKPRLTY
jgi:hypothetical protein